MGDVAGRIRSKCATEIWRGMSWRGGRPLTKTGLSSGPRVEDGFERHREVRNIARHEGQIVNLGRCRDKGVHGLDRPARHLTTGENFAASVGDYAIDRKDSSLESQWQLFPKP